MAERILREARRALPRDKVLDAFSGTVRPSPGLSSLVLAVVAIALTAGLVVGLGLTPLVGVPIAVVLALAVAAPRAFATDLVVFAVTKREIVVPNWHARGRRSTVGRHIEWTATDPAGRRSAGDIVYVNVRTFGPAIDALLDD
jgi:hypothetical protein